MPGFSTRVASSSFPAQVGLPIAVCRRSASVRRRAAPEAEPEEPEEPEEAEPASWHPVRMLVMVASLLFSGYILLRVIPGSPLYAPRAQPAPFASSAPCGPQTVAIGDVQVGDRIAGRNPLREQVDPNAPEPDPQTWGKLVLRMKQESGR